MRKTSKGSKTSLKVEQPAGSDDAVKVKAVNEMMERIKHGVVLRPVKTQDSKQRVAVKQPPVSEEKSQESAMDELKGILETVKRSPSRGSQEAPSPTGKKDSELEVILRRRRNKAGETGSGDERDGHLSHVSSCDSLNGRCASSESGKDTDGSVTPSNPTLASRPVGERRGSGPGPVVARRRSSDKSGTCQERQSGSSVSEKDTANTPVRNGCEHSVTEDATAAKTSIRSNGVDHGEGTRSATFVVGDMNDGDTESHSQGAF